MVTITTREGLRFEKLENQWISNDKEVYPMVDGRGKWSNNGEVMTRKCTNNINISVMVARCTEESGTTIDNQEQ